MAVSVAAFGPSLVDVAVELPPVVFDDWCAALGVDPGGWRALHGWASVTALIGRLAGTPVEPGSEFEHITRGNVRVPMALSAGSSTLGMLSAMPARIRRHSTYVSALARDADGLDPFSEFFAAAVAELQLAHCYHLVSSHNPIGFVVYTSTTPDRTLATYAGVATESPVPELDAATRPDLFILDSYELLPSPGAADLHALITSRRLPIGLSLGSEDILTGQLVQRLRTYIDGGLIDMLFGNSAEYRALYPELPATRASLEEFGKHPVRRSVGYCLLTDGERGMAAHMGTEFVRTEAEPVADGMGIVNTSGAGDTAAGTFVAGMLEGMPSADVLARCTTLASQVITVAGSRIVG